MALNQRTKVIGQRELRRALHVIHDDPPYPTDVPRPRTRGDCLEGGDNASRPCPWASCRHSLLLDVTRTGGVLINFPEAHDTDDYALLPDTCSLDVADRGGATLEEIAQRLHVVRERVRQIEAGALRRARRAEGGWPLDARQLLPDDVTYPGKPQHAVEGFW